MDEFCFVCSKAKKVDPKNICKIIDMVMCGVCPECLADAKLGKWFREHPGCAQHHAWCEVRVKKCTCGLEEALEKARIKGSGDGD